MISHQEDASLWLIQDDVTAVMTRQSTPFPCIAVYVVMGWVADIILVLIATSAPYSNARFFNK